MKKQLLTGAFVLASFLTAQAQETVYSQGFEDIDEVFPEEGASWGNIDLDGDTASFFVFNSQAALTQLGFSGQVSGSGNFVTDNQGNIISDTPDSDNIFASIPFSIPADQSAYVTFKLAGIAIDAGALSSYEIYVIGDAEAEALSTATTAAEFATALDAITPALSGNAANAATTFSVDLADYDDQTVEIFFRHRNGGDLRNYLFMDDFTLLSGVLSSDKFMLSSLVVSPNPANDVVNIANNDNILVNGVTVTDLNGRIVKTASFNGVSNAQVNVSDLASGVYMFTISSDKGVATKKIVKN